MSPAPHTANEGRTEGPDAPAAGLAAAVARAWEARRIYGPDHDAARKAVEQVAAATRGLARVTFHIHESGISLDQRPLEPAAAYQGLADRLMSLNAVAITFTGPLDPGQAGALVEVLGGGLPTGESDLDAAIARVTGGAVLLHSVSAEGLSIDQTPASTEAGALKASLTLTDVINGGPYGEGNAPLREVLTRLAGDRGTPGPESASPGVAGSGPGGEWLGEAILNLSPESQRELLRALSSEGLVPYDRAIGALARLPVESVAQAIGVIGRTDALLSETSLLLLRRYAHLAAQSPGDLARLAKVAASWSSPQVPDGPEKEMASATSGLLTKLAATEHRSPEYSRFLRELVDLPFGSPSETRSRIEQDIAGAPERIVGVLVAVLTDRAGLSSDRASVLEALSPRMLSAAEAGAIDAVRTVLDAAGQISASPDSPGELASADRLLKRAEREQWTALCIARCGDAGRLRALLEQNPKDPLRLLIQAAVHARSPAERRAMIDCASMYAPGAVVAAARRVLGSRGKALAGVCYLLAGMSGGDPIERLRPMLTGWDEEVRREAMRSLGRLRAPWPAGLCVRAMHDSDASIRCLGAERLAQAHPGRIDLLISRLLGRIGLRRTSDEERALLVGLIERGKERLTTRRLCLHAVQAAVLPGRREARALLMSLLRERPTTLSSRFALGLASARARTERRAA